MCDLLHKKGIHLTEHTRLNPRVTKSTLYVLMIRNDKKTKSLKKLKLL